MKNNVKYFVNKNPYQSTIEDEADIQNIANKYNMERTYKPEEADLAVSLGGDGTFLDTAKLAVNADIIGVNRGTLGYLAEINPGEVYTAIDKYMNDKYYIQKRMMLNAYVSTDTETSETISALNDVVITKDTSSVIDIEISVDGVLIARYYADGIIIATPTGSTGYSFSCGAPIIDPSSEMIIITPIAPHSIMNRSIIVPGDSSVDVKLLSARNDDVAKLSIDGTASKIAVGNIVTVYKANEYTKLVKFDCESFLNRVMQKMNR